MDTSVGEQMFYAADVCRSSGGQQPANGIGPDAE